MMKRIAAFILLVACALAGSMPAGAQIFMGPNSGRQAQKALKKQQKAQSKAAKKQWKKYRKMQQKAARRSRHRR
jgi:hypothetical protein